MIPDLGKYAGPVLSAYGVAIVLLVGLVVVSIWRARKVKAALEWIEGKRNG